MNVFDLMAKISLDTSEYDSGLKSAQSGISSFGSKIKGGLSKVAKIGATAVTAIGAVGAATTAAFVKSAGDVAAYGDNIDKMSQKMGLSASAYQEWDAVMQHSGSSMEAMKASMKTLANAAETNSKAFKELGITEEQLKSMSQEELFEATIAALQNVEDETKRTYLAGKTLGKGATELGALLNTSAEDTQKMRDRVRELGGVMSDDAVKAAAAYQDSLQDMKTAAVGVGRGMVGEMLPALTSIMDGITEIFAGNGDAGIGLVEKGLNNLFGKINNAIPKFIKIGGGIVKALGAAIIKNLPSMMNNGAKIVKSLIDGIIDTLPELLASCSEIAGDLIQTISKTLNEKFPAIGVGFDDLRTVAGNAIAFIQQFWADHGESILTKAKEIWEAIKNAIATAIYTVRDIVSTIIDEVKHLWELFGQQIIDIVTAYWEFLQAIFERVKQGVQIVLTAILAFWDQYGAQIMDSARKVWTFISNVISRVLNIIKKVIKTATSVIKGDWTAALEGIKSITSSIWNLIKYVISNVLNAIKAVISTAWGVIKSIVSIALEAIKSKVESVWNTIKEKISKAINSAKDAVNTAIEAIKGYFASIVPSTITSKFETIKKKISDAINGAKDAVSSAIETIKGVLNTTLSFPKIKVPHFSITGGEAPWGIGGAGSPPVIDIQWYAKAMKDAYLLSGASIFGTMGGKFLGGGEAGNEILIGEQKALSMISAASGGAEIVALLEEIFRYLRTGMPSVLRDALADGLSFEIDGREFGRAVRAYAE